MIEKQRQLAEAEESANKKLINLDPIFGIDI